MTHDPSAPVRRRRGRPRNAEPREKVTIDMPASVFDEYCRRAQTARKPLRRLLREVLTKHAQS